MGKRGKVLGHVLFSVCLCTRERMLLCRASKYAEFHPKLFSKRLLRRDSWDRELIGFGNGLGCYRCNDCRTLLFCVVVIAEN
ncbi:hypothetical protein CEXT_657431 [Caerostris extrusa]|uniref:Secreted protein n=1 Tax=Caerostris extrusa TaxID=172846 RepID=A0AAV4XZ51_CAEEX|nr:hypothetical protein CEXT_657431 [Caerostris extrusa]